MDSHKLILKFYVTDPSGLHGESFVPLFHSWIQQKRVPDHLLIDVADYEHVPDGPGTLLIAHEANFSMDHMDKRLGLMYVRKQPFPGTATFAERLRALFRATLEAAVRFEEDPKLAGRIKFKTDDFAFRINDRLHGPNTGQTFAAVKDDLATVVTELYGAAPKSLDYVPSNEALFEVRVKTAGTPSVAELLRRLPDAVIARR